MSGEEAAAADDGRQVDRVEDGVDSRLEVQYVTGQARATFPALFEDYRAACTRAESLDGWLWDLPYGPRPRQTMDVRLACGSRQAAVIYLHAGYWQSRGKSMFRFIAPPLNEGGYDVVLANYPLCPQAPMAEIVDAVAALPGAVQSVLSIAPGRTPLVAVGHSAGAQLAAQMVLRERTTQLGKPRISGVLGISGVYDLLPLMHTSLNAKLRLDPSTAAQFSPVHHLAEALPPAAFVAGAHETDAFLRQTEAMAHAWRGLGASRHATAAGEDHFTILGSLIDPAGLLRSLLLELVAVS